MYTKSTMKKFILVLNSILLFSFVIGDKVEESDDSCVNNTLCENTTISEIPDEDDDDVNIKELATGIFKFTESTKTIIKSSTTTESSIDKGVDLELNIELAKIQKVLEERSKDKFCGCDLTVRSYLIYYEVKYTYP